MHKIKITIITVTYNSANTLQSTIDSIGQQTARENIEYIVIDGGSNDGTQEIIKANAQNISKWISEPDKGIYDAMNKGFNLATGDWIGYLHADDVLASKNTIEQVLVSIDHVDYNVLYGNLNYVKADNLNHTIRHWKSQIYHSKLLKQGWMPPHPTLYVKKELFTELKGFDTSFKIAADYDFILRLFSHRDTKPFFLDQLIVKMRIGGASNKSISNIIQKSKEDYRALKKNKVGGIYALTIKNISKLNQFFKHS